MVDSGQTGFIRRGDEFRQQAAAKLKGSFFGNMMQGKEERKDQAKELYQ